MALGCTLRDYRTIHRRDLTSKTCAVLRSFSSASNLGFRPYLASRPSIRSASGKPSWTKNPDPFILHAFCSIESHLLGCSNAIFISLV